MVPVPLLMTLSDLWPGFEGHDIFWSRISEKLARLKTKLLLHKRKVYLPHGMVLFGGDLDWPLNSSRGFVSISWASCLTLPTIYTQLRDSTVVIHRQTRENKYQVLKYPPNLTHRWTQFMSMSEVGGRVWTREHSIPVFIEPPSPTGVRKKKKTRKRQAHTGFRHLNQSIQSSFRTLRWKKSLGTATDVCVLRTSSASFPSY